MTSRHRKASWLELGAALDRVLAAVDDPPAWLSERSRAAARELLVSLREDAFAVVEANRGLSGAARELGVLRDTVRRWVHGGWLRPPPAGNPTGSTEDGA